MTRSSELAAPRPHLMWFEPWGGLELPRTALRWRHLAKGKAETPRAVMVLPGFSGGERSMGLIAAMLQARGHRVEPWGLGRNRGLVPHYVETLCPRVAKLADESGGPIELIGWSLGGVIAREVARLEHRAVRSVVTMGSPIQGGPKYTALAGWAQRRGDLPMDLDALEAMIAERNAVPLPARQLNIYTKRDGIVGWQACVDPVSPNARHAEVKTTHVGLGAHAPTLKLARDFIEQ